jgi:periplasmic protein TonB
VKRLKRWIRLPRDRTKRTLALAIVTSVLFHLLFLVPFVMVPGFLRSPTYVKRGEPLLVDITPEKPEEKAPLGNPSRPVGPPEVRQRETPSPSPPIAPAPRAPRASRPAPPTPTPPPPAVAKAEPPAPDAIAKTPEARPSPPEPKPSEVQPSEAATPASPTSRPGSRPLASIYRQPPGGGGGLKGGGHGGVEGAPIPLDTPEPRFQDYMNKVREKIRANWIYPREAGDRGIEGQLLIEFHIAKNGSLEFIELRDSSGVRILDDYALTAVKLAQPFPPVPDELAKATLPVSAQFRYQIVSGLVNQLLR